MRNICTLFLLFAFFTGSAQDGVVDGTYGASGLQIVNIPSGQPVVTQEKQKIAVLSNGKILQCFSVYNGSTYDFGLIRYDADGYVDPTFNSAGTYPGMITTDFGGYDVATSMTVQPDGKILVGGYKKSSSSSADGVFALARYNSNGTIDNTFGSSGKVTTAIGTDAESYSIAQGGGITVLAGVSFDGTAFNFALARYTSTGALDATFGSGGKVTTTMNFLSVINSIAVQGDGKVLAGGYTSDFSTTQFALVRYAVNGSLDATFDGDGKVFTSIGGINDIIKSVIYEATTGKIIVAGVSNMDNTHTQFALARYTSTGALDATFGSGGEVTTSIGAADIDAANVITQQNDGKYVVGGITFNGADNDFAVARYLYNGSLDPSFNSAGSQPGINIIDFGADDLGYDIQPQGSNLIFAGTTGTTLATTRLINSTAILPVSLVNFTATRHDASVLLGWQTAAEEGVLKYEVLRSADGSSFSKIGEVAAQGNSAALLNYSFTDAQPAQPISFYRLRIVNANGSTSLSKIISVKFDARTALEVYPNPVRNVLNLQLTQPAGAVKVQIINAAGQVVRTIGLTSAGGTLSASVDMGNCTPGLYFVRVNEQMVKVIKQ